MNLAPQEEAGSLLESVNETAPGPAQDQGENKGGVAAVFSAGGSEIQRSNI
jgi:hypothetical protein